MDISNNDVASSPVATGGRRKSGRAVKAPNKFKPDAPSSQAGPTSAKRKRGGNEVENGASGNEGDSDLSDPPESEGEEEEVRKPQRRAKGTKKPAAKKPKVVAEVEEAEEEIEEEVEEESELSEAPESAAGEEVRKPRRKAKAAKKSAPKSSKVNGTSHADAAPAMRLPNRPKKAVKRVVIADEATEGLYGRFHNSPIVGVILMNYNSGGIHKWGFPRRDHFNMARQISKQCPSCHD